MSRTSSRRGLSITLVLLVIVLAALDLMRTDSFLLGIVNSLRPESRTPVEQGIEEFRRTRGGTIRP